MFRVPLMSASESARSPLVYLQDDDSFVMLVGEPVEMSEQSRIVIGQADRIYAEALRAACAEAFPRVPVQVCRSAAELLEALRARPAEFVLTGLTFADADGIDVLEANAREQLARRVFVISIRKDEHTLRVLRAARFDGFFDPEEEGAVELAGALQQVAGGRGYISAALCRRLIERRAESVLSQRLTAAEMLVFSLIGDGTDDDAAAQQLGLTRATVQSHRRNVMRKLDVGTSAKLVREAVRLGVVRIRPDGKIIRPAFERMFNEWQARRKSRMDSAR